MREIPMRAPAQLNGRAWAKNRVKSLDKVSMLVAFGTWGLMSAGQQASKPARRDWRRVSAATLYAYALSAQSQMRHTFASSDFDGRRALGLAALDRWQTELGVGKRYQWQSPRQSKCMPWRRRTEAVHGDNAGGAEIAQPGGRKGRLGTFALWADEGCQRLVDGSS
ncbi:predicted protein [Pyrenophora tritici-repentis Pt-1C-BFP]|uniref:Uncharacterized protein n=1 Tax=Pyrenophora tritici-repentis (strain Pt-1C-BFP) TaxID=426418 RepID=B2WAG3_PYRTR|nr:uncharacterized protein PTRG_07276 [Pyrenophora tritici-repentis Pt-1C-BFP]EDU50195.1 predicted protein [Pyrenophora tritici-repentis Pt-1C-BFP]